MCDCILITRNRYFLQLTAFSIILKNIFYKDVYNFRPAYKSKHLCQFVIKICNAGLVELCLFLNRLRLKDITNAADWTDIHDDGDDTCTTNDVPETVLFQSIVAGTYFFER